MPRTGEQRRPQVQTALNKIRRAIDAVAQTHPSYAGFPPSLKGKENCGPILRNPPTSPAGSAELETFHVVSRIF
jgi:hypothetical protein